MSLGRGLMSFGTGFLGGLSDIAADKKAKDDEYQSLVTALEFRGKEKEQDFEFNQKELTLARERRKDALLGLGFTEDYLDAFGQFALESDANTATWLQMNQDRYGTPFWMTTPIKYHHDSSYIGRTVQDLQLDSFSKNQTFDNKKVVNNVKNENNLTDNIADSQFSDTPVSGNSVSSTAGGYGSPIFADKEFFFGKAQFRTGEPKTFIGDNGVMVTAFQVEQTPGKGDYGATYYVNTPKGHETLPNFYGNSNYFDIDSEPGKRFANEYFPTMKDQTPMSYHMSIGGNQYILHGYQQTTTDNKTKQVINHMPYGLTSQYPSLFTSQYTPSVPGVEGAADAPGAGFMTQDNMQYYEYDVAELRNNLTAQNFNFNLNAFKQGQADEFALAKELAGIEEPRTLSLVDRNKIKALNLAPSSGFDFNPQQLNYNEFDNSYFITVFGNTSTDKIKRNLLTNISDPIFDAWQNRNIDQDTINALGIDANSDDVTAATLASRIGLVTDQIASNVRSYYTDLAKVLTDEQFATFVSEAPNPTVQGEPLTKENIDQWALESLSEVTSFKDLIDLNDQINSIRQADFDTNLSNTIGSIEGANGDVSTGMDIIDGIILNNMAKDGDTDLLGSAILNAFGGNQAAADLVTQNYVAGKLAQIDTDTLPERAIGEIEKEEEARTEQIEDIDVEQWLREGSVGAIPKIPSEAAEWRRENRSDPNVKTAGGGQGSLYDEDTGFLIFKSPDLPPNHVEPRPGGDNPNANAGFGSKTTQNWDLLYSKTHNADGTPKTEE